MTIDDQIDELEELLDEEREELKEKSDSIIKGLLFAIISLGVLYDVNKSRERAKYLSEVRNEINSANDEIVGLFSNEYGMGIDESILGYTLSGLISSLNDNSYSKLNKIIKNKHNISNRDLFNLFENSYKMDTIIKTLNNYNIEKGKDKETSAYGWVSIAVLDKKTSSVCRRLDGEYYSGKTYKYRKNIPNRPPRHFNCRSVLVKIENKKDFEKFSS